MPVPIRRRTRPEPHGQPRPGVLLSCLTASIQIADRLDVNIELTERVIGGAGLIPSVETIELMDRVDTSINIEGSPRHLEALSFFGCSFVRIG